MLEFQDTLEAHFGDDEADHDCEACFEHGQWWVICLCGASWSVVDASNDKGDERLDFEQIAQGEGEG